MYGAASLRLQKVVKNSPAIAVLAPRTLLRNICLFLKKNIDLRFFVWSTGRLSGPEIESLLFFLIISFFEVRRNFKTFFVHFFVNYADIKNFGTKWEQKFEILSIFNLIVQLLHFNTHSLLWLHLTNFYIVDSNRLKTGSLLK